MALHAVMRRVHLTVEKQNGQKLKIVACRSNRRRLHNPTVYFSSGHSVSMIIETENRWEILRQAKRHYCAFHSQHIHNNASRTPVMTIGTGSILIKKGRQLKMACRPNIWFEGHTQRRRCQAAACSKFGASNGVVRAVSTRPL